MKYPGANTRRQQEKENRNLEDQSQANDYLYFSLGNRWFVDGYNPIQHFQTSFQKEKLFIAKSRTMKKATTIFEELEHESRYLEIEGRRRDNNYQANNTCAKTNI